jgi:hypothetical protein
MLLVLLCIAGCSDDSGSSQDAAVDSVANIDGATPDRGAADRSISDRSTDTMPTDSSPMDSAIADAVPTDAGAAPLSDAAAQACSWGTAQSTTENNVVACIGTGGATVDQCTAEKIVCGSGWHLCTSDDYWRIAKAKTITSQNVWLAGCVRDGAAAILPTNAVCSACSTATGKDVTVAWSCANSTSISSKRLHLGLYTTGACTHVGKPENTTAAHWRPRPSSDQLSGALCCK